MAVSGVFGWANIRGLEASVSVSDEVYRGTETLLYLRLRNTKRLLPSFLLRVEILGANLFLPHLANRQEERTSFTHVFPSRGLAIIGLCTVSSPFPVNFFVRSAGISLNREVIVFPAPRPTRPGEVAGPRGAPGGGVQRKSYEGEVAKIGNYSGAEPLKMIHWRLSAKHVELKVKQIAGVNVDPVIIDPDLLPGETIEERLSRGVFLVNRLIQANRPVGLKLKGVLIPPAHSRAHRLRLLKELALHVQD